MKRGRSVQVEICSPKIVAAFSQTSNELMANLKVIKRTKNTAARCKISVTKRRGLVQNRTEIPVFAVK